jgi:hypothetical protein
MMPLVAMPQTSSTHVYINGEPHDRQHTNRLRTTRRGGIATACPDGCLHPLSKPIGECKSAGRSRNRVALRNGSNHRDPQPMAAAPRGHPPLPAGRKARDGEFEGRRRNLLSSLRGTPL